MHCEAYIWCLEKFLKPLCETTFARNGMYNFKNGFSIVECLSISLLIFIMKTIQLTVMKCSSYVSNVFTYTLAVYLALLSIAYPKHLWCREISPNVISHIYDVIWSTKMICNHWSALELQNTPNFSIIAVPADGLVPLGAMTFAGTDTHTHTHIYIYIYIQDLHLSDQ